MIPQTNPEQHTTEVVTDHLKKADPLLELSPSENDQPREIPRKANKKWKNPKIRPVLLKPEYQTLWIYQGYIGGKFRNFSGYRWTLEALSTISFVLLFNVQFYFRYFEEKQVNWYYLLIPSLVKWILYFPDFISLLFYKERQSHPSNILHLFLVPLWLGLEFYGGMKGIKIMPYLGFGVAAITLVFLLTRSCYFNRNLEVIKKFDLDFLRKNSEPLSNFTDHNDSSKT